MRRWLTLLTLLLLPGAAIAAPATALADVSATIIHYAYLLLFFVGIAQIVRIVFLHLDQKPTGSALLLAAGTVVIPAIFIAVWDHLPESAAASGAAYGGGRAYVENMLSNVGLLNASALWSAKWFSLLFLAVSLASISAVFLKASSAGDEQGWQSIKQYFTTSVLILVVFFPGWTMQGAATSGDVLRKLNAANPIPQTAPIAGAMSESDAVIQQLSSQKNLKLAKNSNPQIPVVLGLVNEALDDAIDAIATMFGSETFGRFGLINSRRAMAGIHFQISNPDLEKRMQQFVWNCWGNAIMNEKPPMQGGVTKANAADGNPFSARYLPYYRGWCKKVLRGGYEYAGIKYSAPLPDEILGNLAFEDTQLREWYKWKDVSQAVAAAPRLRGAVYNVPSSKLYFANMADALIARAMGGAFSRMRADVGDLGGAGNMIQSQRIQENDNWLTAFAGMFGGAGLQMVSNIKGAAETEAVNLKMPIYMGLISAIFLSLFPVVLMLAMVPGRASWVGYHISALAWAKSYIIPWALISQVDTWMSSLDLSLAQEQALVSVIQQAQLYSPVIMALVIFGPSVGAQMMSRGGGSA